MLRMMWSAIVLQVRLRERDTTCQRTSYLHKILCMDKIKPLARNREDWHCQRPTLLAMAPKERQRGRERECPLVEYK